MKEEEEMRRGEWDELEVMDAAETMNPDEKTTTRVTRSATRTPVMAASGLGRRREWEGN
ncbi:hypothetical protein DY000_02053833 [Brassica cretica]|uniref:Uncharacterized protein n=1 Tax=Brassica cretica TaxID=69181 RepID=A0ABQ7A4L0_BRACR|nr:hypothetical protein DY000_02053833 [Brassica cretica]